MEANLENAVTEAIRRADSLVVGVPFGVWKVRIITTDSTREVTLPTQSQVGQLAFDLQCLGFTLDIEPDRDTDLLCIHADVPMQD